VAYVWAAPSRDEQLNAGERHAHGMTGKEDGGLANEMELRRGPPGSHSRLS